MAEQYQECRSENLSLETFGNLAFGLKKSVNNGRKFKEAGAPFHLANLMIKHEFSPLPKLLADKVEPDLKHNPVR